MPRVTRTAAAELDLQEIAYHIAVTDGRASTAERVVRTIGRSCETLASAPLLGTAAPHLGADYRVFSVERWVIVYRPVHGGIEVLRVVDGARDYPRLFNST